MAGRPPSRGVSGEAPWLPRPLLWGRPSCPPAPGLAKGAGVTPVSRRAGSPRGGPARPCLFLRRARFTGALRASGPEWTAVSSQRRGRCPLLRGVCDVSSSQKRDSDTAVVPLSAEGEGEARSGGAGARRESGAVGLASYRAGAGRSPEAGGPRFLGTCPHGGCRSAAKRKGLPVPAQVILVLFLRFLCYFSLKYAPHQQGLSSARRRAVPCCRWSRPAPSARGVSLCRAHPRGRLWMERRRVLRESPPHWGGWCGRLEEAPGSPGCIR